MLCLNEKRVVISSRIFKYTVQSTTPRVRDELSVAIPPLAAINVLVVDVVAFPIYLFTYDVGYVESRQTKPFLCLIEMQSA